MACTGYVCSASCLGNCTAACGSTCYGGCAGGCHGSCVDGCASACNNNCSAACRNDCSGTCKGGCKGGCKGSCTGACNAGCTSTNMKAIYNRLKNLGLDTFIKEANVQDILDLSYNEAARRSVTKYTADIQTTSNKTTIFTYIKNNLTNSGNPPSSYGAQIASNNIINRQMGQELINKAIQLYETTIGLN